MSETSPILSMPLIQQAQAQKHITHNEALRILDGAVQLSAVTRQVATPPATAEPGARYIVAAGGTEAWAGRDGEVAVSELGGGWHFLTPRTGWLAWIEDEARIAVRRPAPDGWTPVGTEPADTLGLNTTADTTNRLAVAAEAILLTHDGAGHQVKVNKAGAGDTASLLYQTGFSGRAEMGLTGSDDFAIKVSADGATWADALRADAATGAVTLPRGARIDGALTGTAVTQGPADATPGRVIRTQDGYVRATVVGPVSQTAGVPTGAIIERGATANGSYVRHADGTQICTSPELPSGAVNNSLGAMYRSDNIIWTFPANFIEPPVVSGMAGHTGRWLGIGPVYLLSTFIRVISATSSIDDRPIRLMAVGRWF